MAVAAACVTLRERLAPVAAGLLGTTAEQVEFAGGEARVRGTEREGAFCAGVRESVSRPGEFGGDGFLQDAGHPVGLEHVDGAAVSLLMRAARRWRGRGGRLHGHEPCAARGHRARRGRIR
jgi:Arc/MetJ family transcription regulator